MPERQVLVEVEMMEEGVAEMREAGMLAEEVVTVKKVEVLVAKGAD